ncbi:hypothetical protein [Streptomyces sp. BA2]|uniref:hypothetical protein n=1 Tax=Streptomyces sp. BA2 TaxID=436595 RepID=UPI00132802B4|nr:hypothetical protein [Streptomyces sp. BA2]MWA16169.1 hypothetical protein [Streptomyces sp. BA2]
MTLNPSQLGDSVSVDSGESLAERRLPLVLDFVPGAREVLSQPFTPRFTVSGRPMEHVPDFAVSPCSHQRAIKPTVT